MPERSRLMSTYQADVNRLSCCLHGFCKPSFDPTAMIHRAWCEREFELHLYDATCWPHGQSLGSAGQSPSTAPGLSNTNYLNAQFTSKKLRYSADITFHAIHSRSSPCKHCCLVDTIAECIQRPFRSVHH